MSGNNNSLRNLFGKYWLIQITLIIVLLLYSVFTSISIFVLVNEPPSNTNGNSTSVIVTIIFDSKVPEKPIIWNSAVIKAQKDSTLLEVMNSTFTLSGTSYGSLGFLVNGINSIQSDSTHIWNYYYFTKDSGWICAPIGVSHFILGHDYQFKWVFGSKSC